MNELSAFFRVTVDDGANQMGGVTCEPFHAQIDINNPYKKKASKNHQSKRKKYRGKTTHP
jgi:hypothetical protein